MSDGADPFDGLRAGNALRTTRSTFHASFPPMKPFSKFLSGLALLLAAGTAVSAKEETLGLYQDRRVTINVPEKFNYSTGRDARGIITVKITDPNLKTNLLVSFFPDPDGRLAKEDDQRAFVAETTQTYAEGSVEKGYDFKDLAPHTGSGMYCVFTDATLVRKAPLPPGEYLKVTSGVKAWAGGFFLFTLLSNDTTSEEYQAGMKLLRESFEEKRPAGPPI